VLTAQRFGPGARARRPHRSLREETAMAKKSKKSKKDKKDKKGKKK
jgi:hypothetical protein